MCSFYSFHAYPIFIQWGYRKLMRLDDDSFIMEEVIEPLFDWNFDYIYRLEQVENENYIGMHTTDTVISTNQFERSEIIYPHVKLHTKNRTLDCQGTILCIPSLRYGIYHKTSRFMIHYMLIRR